MAKQTKRQKEKLMKESTANRYVGYLDIMGFKDMVARNTHHKIYSMMTDVAESMNSTQSVFSVDYDTDEDDEVQTNIIMMTYSDSIMVYSKDGGVSSRENFIASIASLTDSLFHSGIPFKGAVAFGTMTLDFRNSIFFGQPLIDAYLLSEELSFYGIVAHASAEYKAGFRNDESIIKYLCPFKNGAAQHLTISPITFLPDSFEVADYKKLYRAVSKLGNKTSGSIRKYIDNTLKYLEHAREEMKKYSDDDN